ncbi:hypothetical protein HDU93_007973 [Gonapodya sp. JEL0774]|nr:hypothetical protein HDU93_007973 [Gonapodya sp. JEL0774]
MKSRYCSNTERNPSAQTSCPPPGLRATNGSQTSSKTASKRILTNAIAVATGRGDGGEDFEAQVDVLATQVEQLAARFLADTDRLQRKVMDLEGVNRELGAKLQVAERQTAALSTRLEETTSRLSSRLSVGLQARRPKSLFRGASQHSPQALAGPFLGGDGLDFRSKGVRPVETVVLWTAAC